MPGICCFGGYARSPPDCTRWRCPPCSALARDLLRSPDISCPCCEVLGPLHWEAQQFPHVQIPCAPSQTLDFGFATGAGDVQGFSPGEQEGFGYILGNKGPLTGLCIV